MFTTRNRKNTLKSPKRLIFALFRGPALLLIALALPMNSVYAGPISAPINGGMLRMELPDNFESVASPSPEVVVAAKNVISGFPTITVTRHSGLPLAHDGRIEDLAEGIAADYRSVGFSDTAVIDQGFIELQGTQTPYVLLQFDRSKTLLRASVHQVAVPDGYLLITWMEPADTYEKNREIRSAALRSILVPAPNAAKSVGPESQTAQRGSGWFWALTGLFSLAAVLLWIFRRLRHSGTP